MSSLFTTLLQHARLIQTSISVSLILQENSWADRYLCAWFADSCNTHISPSADRSISKIYVGSYHTDLGVCLHTLHSIINARHIFRQHIGHTDKWGKVYYFRKFDPECQYLKVQYHRILTQLQNFHYYKKPNLHEYYYYYYYYETFIQPINFAWSLNEIAEGQSPFLKYFKI